MNPLAQSIRLETMTAIAERLSKLEARLTALEQPAAPLPQELPAPPMAPVTIDWNAVMREPGEVKVVHGSNSAERIDRLRTALAAIAHDSGNLRAAISTASQALLADRRLLEGLAPENPHLRKAEPAPPPPPNHHETVEGLIHFDAQAYLFFSEDQFARLSRAGVCIIQAEDGLFGPGWKVSSRQPGLDRWLDRRDAETTVRRIEADMGVLQGRSPETEPHDYGVDLAAGAAKSLAHREQLDRVAAQQARNQILSGQIARAEAHAEQRVARAYWALAERLTRLHAGNDTAYEIQLAELFDAIGSPEHPGAPDEVKRHD